MVGHWNNDSLNACGPCRLPQIRNTWRYYYEGAEAIIFVVDSQDKHRVGEGVERSCRTVLASAIRFTVHSLPVD